MPYEIRRWEEIAGDFQRGTVLVGKGASIAIDRGFAYEALLQVARRRGLQPKTPTRFQQPAVTGRV